MKIEAALSAESILEKQVERRLWQEAWGQQATH